MTILETKLIFQGSVFHFHDSEKKSIFNYTSSHSTLTPQVVAQANESTNTTKIPRVLLGLVVRDEAIINQDV